MRKSLLVALALAGGLAIAGLAKPASANVLVPMIGTSQSASHIERVRWVCGRWACHWIPGYRGPVRPWARRWAPPPRRGCWWRRNRHGHWVMVCP